MKLATSAQMRAMDREAIAKYAVPAVVLMENAALRVVEEMARRWAPLAGKRIVVICGKGNNGGDGLAIARHLAVRIGATVSIWLTEPIEPGSQELIANRDMALAYGLALREIVDLDCLCEDLRSADLIVDAILGTGAQGAPREAAARAIEAIELSAAPGHAHPGLRPPLPKKWRGCGETPVIAVDIPSGVGADTGEVAGPAVHAALTVTFGLSKPGLHVFPGAEYAGEVAVAHIGFAQELTAGESLNYSLTDAADCAAILPARSQSRDANKGKFGSVLILAGSAGFAGAACLAAHGSVRAGAGLITLGVPKSIFDVVMTRAQESVMTRAFADSSAGAFSPAAVKPALALCEKMNAAAIGPGVTHAEAGVREFVHRFVRDCPVPLVIDADALNALALLPDHGASLVAGRSAPTLLTPHPGEMGRLLDSDSAAVQADRFGALREAVEAFRSIVLLKGSRTLIGAPDGRVAINATGNAGMASGGMGDALTGIAAAFLGQATDPFRAASAAAFVHGLAGDLAAEALGPAGIMGTDVAEQVPRALARIYA